MFIKNQENILEVGSGHGLFLVEVLKATNKAKVIDVVDISKSSINMTKSIINSLNKDYLNNINFFISDINKYQANKKYDFIIMGEVIEHVDDPLNILKKSYSLLSNNGKVFITTCANCPTIDHVYYFRNVEEIRELLITAGYKIDSELIVPSENKSDKYLEKFKVDMMYAAVLKK